jgi:hypothetical protein
MNKFLKFLSDYMCIIFTVIVVLAVCLFPYKAKAFPRGGVIIIGATPYQQCIDTCLAYNGYSTGNYHYCSNACLYPNVEIPVAGGVYINGIFYPRIYVPVPRWEPRHYHEHHGRR